MESPTDKKVDEFKSPKPSIKTSFDDVRKDIVKGYRWMDNICVEDAGVCPYIMAASPISSHTPEYVIATAALSLSGTLFLFALFLLFGRFKYWKRSNKKNIAWKDIFKPNNL